jgi:hypothetical protein
MKGSTVRKMSLAEAGALLGISANAVRARAKKSPAVYGLERDNAGKLWVVLDVQSLPAMKLATGAAPKALEPSTQVQIARLVIEVEAAQRARDVAEADRDHWRSMAEALAAKRWRFWPF